MENEPHKNWFTQFFFINLYVHLMRVISFTFYAFSFSIRRHPPLLTAPRSRRLRHSVLEGRFYKLCKEPPLFATTHSVLSYSAVQGGRGPTCARGKK